MDKIANQRYYKNRSEKAYSKGVVKSCVKEILLSTKEYFNKPIKEIYVLDVGSGSGEISFELEKYFKKVVGVEPFKPIFRQSVINKKRIGSRVEFYNNLIENFNYDHRFDLVVSLTTLEHMPNVEKSFKKILSLMNKGGIIYLTCPNRLWPYENHYKLFLLSWLPIKLANYYIRLTGKGDSYEDSAYSKTYFGIKKLFSKLACKYQFILPKDPNSAYFGCGQRNFYYNFLKKAGIWLIKRASFFWIFSKGFIVIIEKA